MMKKVLSIILTIILVVSVVPTGLFSITASAESNTESYYTYSVYDGKATITAVDESISGDIIIPSTLGGYPVTSIGSYAFYSCESLTSITIPEGVTSIGSYAFSYCSSLESITVDNNNTTYSSEDGVLFNKAKTELIYYPEGKTSSSYTIPSSVTSIGDFAFRYCSSLESVTIGNSVTSIGSYAFYSCSSLESVTIGNSVTSIGSDAFSHCSSLKSITVDNNNTTYSSEDGVLFNKAKTELILYPAKKASTSYTIPNSVTSIGDSAFRYCSSLESVTIGNSVTSIGDYAFANCDGLTNITLGKNIKRLGDYTFSNCSNLRTAVIPDSITYLGRTFAESGIVEITIPGTVKYIESWAFGDCNNLKSVTICDGVEKMGQNVFEYCYSLEDIYLSKTLKNIPYLAFRGCWNLSEIDIPDSVLEIDSRAFEYTAWYDHQPEGVVYAGKVAYKYKGTCPENIIIRDGTLGIAEGAFGGCSKLKSITLPEGLKVIFWDAFNGCYSLETINIPDSVVKLQATFYDTAYYGNEKNWDNECLYIGKHLISVKESFSGTLNVKEGTKTLAYGATEDCQQIKEVNLPEGLVSLGSFSLKDTAINDIALPQSLKYICSYAFNDWISDTVIIPDGVEEIGENSLNFVNNVVLPSNTHILSNNFKSSSLKNIVLPKETTLILNCFVESYGATVWYTGSEEDRNQIEFGDYETLENATWHYNICPYDEHVFEGTQCVNCEFTIYSLQSHIYDNDCDEYCNDCGKYREALHNYYWVTDKAPSCGKEGTKHEECSLCHTKRNIGTSIPAVQDHIYSNNCDSDCNSCGVTRVPYDHIYSHACDSSCNVCGDTRVAASHTYTSDCDSSCNVCGNTRVASNNHIYDSVCDSTCSGCDTVRTAPHTYDNACDGTCNLCGYTRIPDVHRKKIFSDNLPNISTTDSTTYPFALNDGVYSSTNKDHNSSSTFTITALYDCTLQIEYYTSTQSNYDKLTIKHNSTTKVTKSGSTSWATLSIDLSAEDVVEISYSKNYSTSSYNDTIYFKLKSSEMVVADTFEPTCEDAVVCDVCNAVIKPATGHSYTNDYDTTCNTCGASRSISSVTKTDGIFTYTIIPNGDGGKITITEVNTTASGQISVPSALENVPVTSIGENAFEDCTKITGITIPDTVTNIGKYAFKNCSRLTQIEIADSVESMGNYLLYGCTGLLEIKIPYLGGSFGYLFGGSSSTVPPSLKQVTISGGTIPSSAFSGCNNISIVVLGDGVTSIGNNAFANCNSITKVTIGNGTETIGVSAFENCVSLTQVTIGTSVITIGTSAFESCVSLQKIIIPDSTTDINGSAFKNCYSLGTVVLGESVDLIDDSAFENCRSIEEIVIPNSTTLIGSSAFQNCTSLKKAAIGKSVTTIYDSAFAGCTKLEYAVLPNSTTYIGEYAFSGCTSLKRAVIKGRTDHINNGTFSGCSSLVAVAFPVNVNTLAYNAFSGCYNLSEVWYEGTQADRNEIAIAYGNDYIKNATWSYGQFDTVNHKYDNACDEVCNICFEVREAHSYTNSCDTKCNICGKTRPLVHTYDGDCDPQCNVCGATRTAGSHTYDNDCDTSCRHCTHERKAPHNYDDSDDLICNDCGYERPPYTPGDIDGVEGVTDRDAVYLLYHTFLSDMYPVNQDCDFNNDGEVTDKDAVYLLYHTFLPDIYPI